MAGPVLAPRKLPRQPRARASVEANLEAAAQFLESEGLDGNSTNAVAARAGVSVGTLYHYYPH
jgi:AcrR family transcriptional regulator